MQMSPEVVALIQQTIRDAMMIAPTDPAEMQQMPPMQMPMQQGIQSPEEYEDPQALAAGFEAPQPTLGGQRP